MEVLSKKAVSVEAIGEIGCLQIRRNEKPVVPRPGCGGSTPWPSPVFPALPPFFLHYSIQRNFGRIKRRKASGEGGMLVLKKKI